MAADMVLDREVRDWVLLPLTCSVLLMSLLRQYATQLFAGGKPSAAPKAEEMRQKTAVARSAVFRGAAGFIPQGGFLQRKAFFVGKDSGLFNTKPEGKSMQENLMTDPSVTHNMMKQQLGGVLPQMAMGALVNFFFSGFILGRIPFSLSPNFRPMLQRGIDLPSLHPSYFTSLSYYILLLFGSQGIFRLVFREQAINDAAQMMQMQQMQMGAMSPMSFDAAKAFEGERSALNLLEHRWRLEGSEGRAAALLRSQLGQSS